MNKKVEFTATIRIQPSYYKKRVTSNLFLIDSYELQQLIEHGLWDITYSPLKKVHLMQ